MFFAHWPMADLNDFFKWLIFKLILVIDGQDIPKTALRLMSLTLL